ncbi:hypothetical protein EV421DRAFT_1720995, partial [Armillaria borealis]
STANLIHHDCACATNDNDDEPKLVQGNLNAFVQGSTYTARRLHARHVQLSTRHHVSHAFVEWEEYCAILHMFNKDVKIFLADTLSHNIKDVYSLIKTRVAKLLQGARGCIHVAQDGWAASQKLSLLGLVIVWVTNAKMQVLTMDMVQ